ncbi:MAG TPA: lipopolysaccharide biosynthesis protein [Aequorivita sp.]|nr:lipopolysaccharide biosynthesis protein [Aequorivita sp.]
MLWTLLQNIGGQGISFITFIILARLLTPEIFGLTGMLAIFIEMSMLLLNAGFSRALIQKKDADEEDFSSVFWINLGISLVIYWILFFSAPFIAKFYEQPILIDLVRVLSLIFVINSFSLIQEARLTKAMKFKNLTIIKIPSTILGGMVGVVLALLDFGVWSLIFMQLATSLGTAIQLWIYSKWKPLFVFNKTKVKELFSYGGKLMLSGLINRLFVNAYLVVIGKYFPVSFVGYYNISSKLVRLPSQAITGALNTVTFSAFSSIQDDAERLKINIRKVIQQVLFWLCPIFTFAAVLAEPLFSFILTDKWLPAIPYFQLLCVIGVFYPLNIYSLNIINVKGRSDLSLKLVIATKIFAAITIAGSLFIGIWALIISQSMVAIFSYFMTGYFSGKLINYPLKEQFNDIAPIFIMAFGIGGLIYFSNLFLMAYYDWLQLIIGFGLGGGLYLLIAKWRKLAPYSEFIVIINKRFHLK